jgi:hypothetical protein
MDFYWSIRVTKEEVSHYVELMAGRALLQEYPLEEVVDAYGEVPQI